MRLSSSRTKGFTLLELMIVVAIVAILAAIALPSYRDYIVRANLVDGTNQLSAYRARMEQYYQDARQYTTNGANFTTPCPSAVTIKNWTYDCPAASLSTSGYEIFATGAGPVLNFKYSITQTNAQKTKALASGWGAATDNCWIMRKGDTC